MFEDNSDDEPSLDDLFETDDTDTDTPDNTDSTEQSDPSFDDLRPSSETTTTDTTTSDSESESPDWADDLLDTSDEPTDSDSPDDIEPHATTTSASGTGVENNSETSLVISKSSLPTLPFSTDSDAPREWLSTLLSYTKLAIRKLFYIIMAPIIFLLAFTIAFGAYFVPWIIALLSFLAFATMWIENPLLMSIGTRWLWTFVLAVVFLASVFGGFALDDHYSNKTGQ